MKHMLRLRIGELKEEAEETAEFVGVSVSALTRMALRDRIEAERPRMQEARKNAQQPQPSTVEAKL